MMNGQMNQPPVYDGNTKVSVELDLNRWQLILNLIVEAPWKVADPLVKELNLQIQTALEHVEPVKPPASEVRP